ncbi:MAG: glycoside hydrolase family 140 protein [Sphingobacterium sp.]
MTKKYLDNFSTLEEANNGFMSTQLNCGPLRSVFLSMVFYGLFLLTPSVSFGQVSANDFIPGRLTISDNGHFFTQTDGTPFFWLGDTAWELFHRLKRKEIEQYLDNRATKGFNVIQAVIFANTDKPMAPNRYHEVPFFDANPDQPNEAYFRLIDWTLDQALARNLYVGLLPTWGAKVLKLWGKGAEVFDQDKAYRYGLFLGKRYKEYPNIVWIVGGDRPAVTDSVDKRPVWEAMIRGLREGTSKNCLISYHPWGEGSSTDFWSNDGPLDFNMLQSGHQRYDVPVWDWIIRDFQIAPARPILDGEATYEDHPVNWDVSLGYFRDDAIRKQLYRSVFAGASGVTYGHQAVWQFYHSDVEGIVAPDRYWTAALDRPGAWQAGYLKKLILSRPSLDRVPDQSIVLDTPADPREMPVAFRDTKGRYLMVYLPNGGAQSLDLCSLGSETLQLFWYSPRSGRTERGELIKTANSITVNAPSAGSGQDWVLVAEQPGLFECKPGVIL